MVGRYRVVQWATGNIGLRSLQAVIEHPELELVGLYVYSEGKVGKDAGELCGLAPTGVVATRDVDEIVSLHPDCVLYMGDRADIDVICRLLESGANVVATRSEFHHPASLPGDVRERIELGVRARRHVALQHRVEPGVHHRGAALCAPVAPAQARSSQH